MDHLDSFFLVRSEHLNHHGHLFGGQLMAEMDTAAYCLLRQAYPDASFVTRASSFSFESATPIGDIVKFDAYVKSVGVTSATVEVVGRVGERVVATAEVVYVNVGPDGRKAPIRKP